MRQAAILLFLPLPVLLVSISIPKLQGMYDHPAVEVPLTAALATGALAAAAHAGWRLRGPGGARRAAWLAALLAAAGLLAWNIFRTNPIRRAALREVVHIGEYGALGALALVLLAPRLSGLRCHVATLSYAACVGIVDELAQFYHPGRVGDLRDVLTDAGSALLGLLLARHVYGVEPSGAGGPREVAFTRLAAGSVAALGMAFAGLVHTGFRIEDPECGTFHSRLSRGSLESRAARGDPETYRRRQERETRRPVFALEDLYLSEARGHLIARLGAGEDPRATLENAILERYYGPVLRGLDQAWPADRVRMPPGAVDASTYRSPYLADLRTWPARGAWLLAAAVTLGTAVALAVRSLG